jgi:hypothetical protein
VQAGYGWPAAPSTPYAYVPVPPVRKGVSAPAIVGIVALVLVVVIAAGVGTLIALGHSIAGFPGLAQGPAYAYSFKDSLDGTSPSGWSVGESCYFKGGAYHVNPVKADSSEFCVSPAESLSDFDLQVTASQAAGALDEPYGLGFRHEEAGSYYVFLLQSDGTALFLKHLDGKWIQVAHAWDSPTFHKGLNAQNTMRVVAHESTFTFYVNGVLLGQVTDTTYIRGAVGLVSGDTGVDAVFTNFEVKGNT